MPWHARELAAEKWYDSLWPEVEFDRAFNCIFAFEFECENCDEIEWMPNRLKKVGNVDYSKWMKRMFAYECIFEVLYKYMHTYVLFVTYYIRGSFSNHYTTENVSRILVVLAFVYRWICMHEFSEKYNFQKWKIVLNRLRRKCVLKCKAKLLIHYADINQYNNFRKKFSGIWYLVCSKFDYKTSKLYVIHTSAQFAYTFC